MTETTLERISKSNRLLIDGRLIIERVLWERIEATCRGDSGEVYKLGYNRDRQWFCSCPARGDCSHLRALWMVTIRPKGKP